LKKVKNLRRDDEKTRPTLENYDQVLVEADSHTLPMSSTTITPALQKALIGCAGAAVAVAILKFLYPAQKRIQWAENVRTTISDHLFHEDPIEF
jgi:hypothetical protein